MEIYIVQPGDTIVSISEKYGITIDKLVEDNGLVNTYELVVGQALVITIPKITYTVETGDTLHGIADKNNVPLMQLLRNNPYLYEREYLYPGETIVISYHTSGSIVTNGFIYSYIKQNTLRKTLPNLTYLTIFNYTTSLDGEIIELSDDTDIINTSKEYHAIPLLMLTAITPQGVPNIELAYKVLMNIQFQDKIIAETIDIMKRKGYQGINIAFNYLNTENQMLYRQFVERMSLRLKQEGFLFFITFNYHVQQTNNEIKFDDIDYKTYNTHADGLIFLRLPWGTNYGPPAPVSDITVIRALVNTLIRDISRDKLIIGKPMIGLDWQFPYEPYKSTVVPLTRDTVLYIARAFDAIIHFDENTQTPYFYYNQYDIGYPYRHIVWFVDARSLNAMDLLIKEYDLHGSGVWNVMLYNPQIWAIINSRFDIIKYDQLFF